MVGRLELILTVILIIVTVIALNSGIEAKKNRDITEGNSIEIENVELVEANATDRLDDMRAEFAYQKDGVWHFKDINLTATKVKELRSDKAIRGKDYFELTGHVMMLSDDGSKYLADRAVYLTDKKIFYTLGRFRAERNGTVAVGKNFYHAKVEGFSRAEKVHGIYQMATKDNKCSK